MLFVEQSEQVGHARQRQRRGGGGGRGLEESGEWRVRRDSGGGKWRKRGAKEMEQAEGEK